MATMIDEQRVKWARRLLWVAIIAPFIYTTAKTSLDIESSGVGVLDAVRGGGPLVLLVAARSIASPMRRGHGLVEVSAVVFCAMAAASTGWSVNPTVTALKVVPLIGSYLALAQLVRFYPTALAALNALATATHWLLILTAIQFLAFPSLLYAQGAGTLPRLGTLVPQVSANPLGYAAMAGVLAMLTRVGPVWIMRSWLLRAALTAVYLSELIATRTRTALALALIMIAVAFLVMINRRPALVINTTLAAVVAVWWLWPTHGSGVGDFLTRGQTQQGLSTLTGRTSIWDVALRGWSEDKMFGLGYYSGHRLGLPGIAEGQSNLDSTWIETLVDVGLLGLVPLALMIVAGALRVARASELGRDMKLWALGVIGYGIVISFVNPTIQSPGAAMVLTAFPLFATFRPDSHRQPDARALGKGDEVKVPKGD